MSAVAVHGASFHSEVAGQGPGLVFIHVGVADYRMWDAEFTAFQNRFRVVRFDMRGFGRTAAGRLGEIAAPTLVLVGALDVPFLGGVADRIEREVPDARRVVIDGAAHMLNLEKPEEFRRVLAEFLA